jgi:hypothetical protein
MRQSFEHPATRTRTGFGLIIALVVVLASATAPSANAQRTPLWSLDGTVGVVGSYTGALVKEAAVAMPTLDLTFAVRVRPSHNALVLGLNASGGPYASNDMCVFGPDGRCLPSHAGFAFAGLLAGWESRGARVRALAGPAFAISGGPHPVLALQSRIETAISIVRHVALIGSLRAALVPNYESAVYSLVSAGLGLRLRGG